MYVLRLSLPAISKTIEQFLEKLNMKLEPLAKVELAELLELKREEKEARKEPFDGKINMWDFSYYLNQRVCFFPPPIRNLIRTNATLVGEDQV
jgi:Zn-dependent oligopeptidase